MSKRNQMEKGNKILEFPNNELLHEQAAAWIARVDNAQLTQDEILELRQWVDLSAHHKKILLDTAKVWDRMDVMVGLSELLSLEDIPDKRKSFYAPAIPAIAILLFGIGLTVYYYFGKSRIQMEPQTVEVVKENRAPRTYETPIGGIDVINFQDGSIVKLNTATRIEVDMQETQRHVTLLDGEAYFEVARNQKVPFVVTVDKTVIQAVGTAFGVRKLADQIDVTVTEGLVQVKNNEISSSGKAEGRYQPVFLRAGQVALIGQSGVHQITEIDPGEIAHKLLWQQNMLAFDGNTLQEVVDEFSRYTSLKISIADDETAAIRVGGYFRSNDIAGLLTSLEDNFAISVEQTTANSFELQKK